MIGVDWGTSSFRAYRLAPDGAVRDRRSGPQGILAVQDGKFAFTLREAIGPWLAAGEQRVLLCGMIGSRQGWMEAPYRPCPAGAAELASGIVSVPFEQARVCLVPGLAARDEHGVPEVMRGEETQILGVLGRIGDPGLVCLPGTHSKWVQVQGGRIAGFETHMTGEVYAALRGHTILGRMMRDGASDPEGFGRGLARSEQAGGLLHHLFGIRSMGLAGQLAEGASGSYLSGLLIGHEVRAALAPGSTVHLIGAAELCGLYARAITACGGTPVEQDADAAARGLHLIGEQVRWS